MTAIQLATTTPTRRRLSTTITATPRRFLAAISASQTAINANTDAGKNELRDLVLRTQIEANLAEDHDDAVGLYMTPGANGGYLELGRAIVIDTIAKLGGKHTADANRQLAQGEAQEALGNFFKLVPSIVRHTGRL